MTTTATGPGSTPAPTEELPLVARPGRNLADVTRVVFRQPAGVIGVTVIGLIVLIAVFAPLVAPFSPTATNSDLILAPPSGSHWLGTDDAGRDVLARLIYGARPALLVGTLAVLIGGLLGIGLGVLSGYYRGAVETVIMRLCDVAFAFPLVLIGICAVVVLGPGVLSVGLAVGLGVAPMFARLARAEVLEEMSRDYVKAANGMGGTSGWIMAKHIVPNIATTMVVQMASAISSAIVIASALDFLGLGTQAPAPSWGNMLQASRSYLSESPIFAISPGVVLTVFVLAVNLFAAALTNALNPRIRTKMLRSRGVLGRMRYRRLSAATAAVVTTEATAMRETD